MESFKDLNVFQKINEVKKVVKAFKQDAETNGKGAYTYVSGSQILAMIKGKMEEVGLLFLPVKTEHRDWTQFNYKNSYGDDKTDFIVTGKIVYEWVNCDNPDDIQSVEFEYYGQQNDISKAFGSGLTYSERYLLLKSLGAPTDEEDPDKISEPKTQRAQEPPKKTAQKAKANNVPFPEVPQETKRDKLLKALNGDKDRYMKAQQWINDQFGEPVNIDDIGDDDFAYLLSKVKK